jgi:hypothetical protein
MIVTEDAYDVTEPTVDSHIVKMKSINADVFVNIAGPKFAAQASGRRLRSAGSRCIFSTTFLHLSVRS